MSDVDKIVEYFKRRAAESKQNFDKYLTSEAFSMAELALNEHNCYKHAANLVEKRAWDEKTHCGNVHGEDC